MIVDDFITQADVHIMWVESRKDSSPLSLHIHGKWRFMVERLQKSNLNITEMPKLYSVSLPSSVKRFNYIGLLPCMSGN